MARYGFIHDKLDIKFLILYLMARVAAPVDFSTLTDLSLCDEGVDYFQFAEAVGELVETGHLSLDNGLYAITEKGRQNGAVCESSLPFSVKRRCTDGLARVNSALRRSAQVRCDLQEGPGEGFTVTMALDDEGGNLLTLSLYSPTREQAKRLADSFQARPEKIYKQVLAALLEEPGGESRE